MLWFCRQKEKKKQIRDQRRAEMEKENQSGSHGKGYLKLFGVEIRTNVSDDEESMKKRISMGGLELSISLNNENDDNVGYLSDSLLQSSTPETAHHRKKKVTQWSREEHQNFLVGLKEKGKGNWKEIATKFVKTRTTSQVASHAQKYYLRRRGRHERRRRPSVFDMPFEPASPSQASASSSSSPCPQQASTSRGLPVKSNVENNYPSNFHGVPYMVGVLPRNTVGSQSFVADRFAPAVSYVPMVILPGPPLAYLRATHRKFAAAATAINSRPRQ
ncbi:putative transcription factor [Vitis vinifera]|uniref:Putative transcription factor n=1 Tax=Vitis vinifera TaxID=29760 RepID=A0A438INF1_VITVI|nr:putative transcription factor [Vitis vinifera]